METARPEQAEERPAEGLRGACTVGGAMGTMTGCHRYGMVFTAEAGFVNINLINGLSSAATHQAADGSSPPAAFSMEAARS